jgi:hypothetical protein
MLSFEDRRLPCSLGVLYRGLEVNCNFKSKKNSAVFFFFFNIWL